MHNPPSPTAAQWVAHLQLQPHPEGGFFRETYRASTGIPLDYLPEPFGAGTEQRQYSTAIYYLLEAGQFSSLHRIKSDEVWHFYAGSCLEVYSINPAGKLSILKLGNDLSQGQVFQGVIPAGDWFGATLAEHTPGNYALVGCTVAPGFDFNDLEFGVQADLLTSFPQHETIIQKLTR